MASIGQVGVAGPAASERVRDLQTWKNYPWLHRAFREIGPGARAASDNWRLRIEDELKTTLDFKLRADGTAAVWCGMSGYDFRHDPSPKELLEGLAEAYRRELERVRTGSTGAGTWKMSASPAPRPTQALGPHGPAPIASPAPAEDSLLRVLGAVLLPRAAQLTLIFVAVTALTLVLAAVANAVR